MAIVKRFLFLFMGFPRRFAPLNDIWAVAITATPFEQCDFDKVNRTLCIVWKLKTAILRGRTRKHPLNSNPNVQGVHELMDKGC